MTLNDGRPGPQGSTSCCGFRCSRFLVLCYALSLTPITFCRQTTSTPTKVLTPEQRELQQQVRELDARRNTLRAQAKEAFDAEMARQKAGDCPNANTTSEFNTCFGKAVDITDQNLQTFERAIRDLLGLKYPSPTDQPPMPGPAGPALTTEQSVEEFDHMEQLWHSYLDAASTTAFHQFDGGTGGPSFEMETHLAIVRSHMTELNNLYGMLLRL